MDAVEKHRLRLSGPSARVCWGYRLVAEVGAWTIDGGALVAQGARVIDPIGLTQRDLRLVIPRGDGRPPWTRALSQVVLDHTTLYAELRSVSEVM